MKKIKVLVMRVNQEPVVEEIENTLHAMQAIVGGHVESVHVAPGLDVFVNEDDRALCRAYRHYLPWNTRDHWIQGLSFKGNFFLVAHTVAGKAKSLTAAQISTYKTLYKLPTRRSA